MNYLEKNVKATKVKKVKKVKKDRRKGREGREGRDGGKGRINFNLRPRREVWVRISKIRKGRGGG